MAIFIEVLISCLIFIIVAGGMTYINPLSMINNYPKPIQDKVKELGLIKDEQTSKSIYYIIKKIFAFILLVVFFAFVVHKFNDADTFFEGFIFSYIIWVSVNWCDALLIDCLWFCHSKRVIIPGTEGMVEYKDYWFHIKGALIGMLYGIPACLLVGLLIKFL